MFEYRKYVYAVYKAQSFSKAAENLFVSQSTLSLMVKKAEKALGAPLFNRKSNPLSLTPLGVEYIHAVEQIHRLEGEIDQFINDEQNLQRGTLTIGGHNFGLNYFLPQKIAKYHQLYPNVNLRIIEMNTVHGKHGLDEGELDFVITNRKYDTKTYVQKTCDRENLVLVVPKRFAVNDKLADEALRHNELGDAIFELPHDRAVNLCMFQDIPFILLSSSNYLRECTNMLFYECKCMPSIIFEMEQSSVSYNFAKMGIGATILSNRLVENDSDNDSVCIYKIKSEYVTRDTYISYKKGSYFTFAMQKFLEMILTH